MHYFVDGYNLLFRSRFPHDVFQKQRDQVITDLADAVGTLGLDLTVVFDSTHTTELSTRQHKGPLEIVYTDGKDTADRLILRAPRRLPCSAPGNGYHLRQTVSRGRAATRRQDNGCRELSQLAESTLPHKKQEGGEAGLGDSHRQSEATYNASEGTGYYPYQATGDTPPAPSSHDYLAIFEQRLQEASEPVVTREGGSERAQAQPTKPKRQPRATKEAPEPDHDRWLRLFEARRDEDE